MSVSKKDIKDISDLIRKKLELYMNVERRESRFDPRGKFTTTPKMHKYDFLYKVLDASVLDTEGRKARQAKGENTRPKSVHSPERPKSAKRSSERAKSSLVRSSHSPRRDRRQNRRVISPSHEKRRRVDEGSKCGSRKRDGGDRAGRSYPRPDANMDESSIVSDSVQTNVSSSVHSRVSSNGIKPKLEDSPSRVVLHREKDRLSSYASKIFSEVPVDEIQLIHRYRPSYGDKSEPKYQGFSRHVGSILKSKNFVHFYNNEALHHSVDKENSESRDRLTSSKKPSRMANRAIKSAHVTKGHDDVIRTAKSSRHTVFSSLIDTAGTGTRLVKATSKEFAASSIESLTPTYTSSFHNIETSTFPQSHDPYRPSDANRPPSPADHFRHSRSVSIASIKSSVTVHFNENKLDEKNRSVSFPVIKQPQERRITEDQSSERMREPKKTKEFTEYYEDPNTKVKVDREKSNVEITKRETVEKDEQVYKIKQIVVVSVNDKKQKENDRTSDTELNESHEITDKEYSESCDATESVNQKSDEEGSERTLSPISDTELTDTAEMEEKQGTMIEREEAQQETDLKSKEEKSVTIDDVQIMTAKRHGHLKPLTKSPSPDMAKNKRRRKRSERDKTGKPNNETLSTERSKGTSDTEKQKQESVEEERFEDLEKEAQSDGNKEINSITGETAVPCTIAKDTGEGAGHSQKTVDDKHKEVVESKNIAKDEKEVSVSDSQDKIEKSEVILNVSENKDDYEDDFEEEDINLSSKEESPRKENQPLETTEKIDVSVKLGSYESTNEQQKTDGVSVDKKNNEGISMNEPGREDDKAGQTKLAVSSDESHTIQKPEKKLSDVTGPKKKEDKRSTETKPEETILKIKQRKNGEETAVIGSKTLENKEREDESFVAVPAHVSRSEKLEDPDDIRVEISEISQARKEIVSVNHEAVKENNLHGLHISNSSINTLIISRDHGNQGQRESKETTTALIGKEIVLKSKDNAKFESENYTNNINVESSNSKDMQSIVSSRNESFATQTISSQATQTINSVQIQTISDMQTQTIESTSTQTTIAAESQTDKQRRFSVSSVDSYQVAEYAKENACQIDMVDIATSPIPETLFVLNRHTRLPSEKITTDSSVTISAKEEKDGVTVDDERNEESKSKQVAENDDKVAQNILNRTDDHLQQEKEIEYNRAHSLVSDKPVLGSTKNLNSLSSEAKMHNNISKDKYGEMESALNIYDRNKESVSHLPKEVEKDEFSKHVIKYENNDPFSKNEISKDGELLPDILSEDKINTEDEISTNIQEDTHKLDSEIIVQKAEIEKQEGTFEEKNLISDEASGDQRLVEIITKPETVDKEIGELTTDLLIKREPENQSTGRYEGSDKLVDELTQEDVKEIPKEDRACPANKSEEHADTHMLGKQKIVEEITADKEFQMNRDVAEKEIEEEVLETEKDLHDETAVPNLQHKQEAKESQGEEEEDKKQAIIDTEISENSGISDSHDHKLEDIVDTQNETDEKADFIKEEKHQNEEISDHNLQFETKNKLNEQEQIMESRFDEKRSTDGDRENVTEENTASHTDKLNEEIASELQQRQEVEEVKDESQDHNVGKLSDREENVDTTMKNTPKPLDPDTELKDDTISPHLDNEEEKNDISIPRKPDDVNDQIQDYTSGKEINKEDKHIGKGTQGKDDTDEKLGCFRATLVEQETHLKEKDSCSNTDIEQEPLDINVEKTTYQEEKLVDLKTEANPETAHRSNEDGDTQLESEIERGDQNKSETQNKEDSRDIGDLGQDFENTKNEKEEFAVDSKQDKEESSGKENDIKVSKVASNNDEQENKPDSSVHDKHDSEEVIALKVTEEDIKQTSVEKVQIDSKVQEQPTTVDNKQQIIETDKLDERDDQATDVLLQDKLKTGAKNENVIYDMEAGELDAQIKSELLSETEDREMGDVIIYQTLKEEQADLKIELKQEIEVSDNKIQEEIIIKDILVEEEMFDSEIQQQIPEIKEIIEENQSLFDKGGNAEISVKSVLLEKPETTCKADEEQLKDVHDHVSEQEESPETKTREKQENEATQHEDNEKEDKKLIYPEDEKTDLSLQQGISNEQMNNAELDIQAEGYASEQFATKGSEEKEDQRIPEVNKEIADETESEQEQVRIQATKTPEDKENEKENKESDIEIDKKHIDSPLLERQEKEERKREELNVVNERNSDKQAENIELLRQETQETVETEGENKYEKKNEQCQTDEKSHTGFEEKLVNEEKTIEVKAFKNVKETVEQQLQNDTVSIENLEVVDISNQHKEVKIKEKIDPEEVKINSNFLEKTENIEQRSVSQDDKVDIQVHAEETDICLIIEREPEVGKEKNKGLDKTEKGNNENEVRVKFKTEEKQEPQQSGNQEIHDETLCEQKQTDIEITQKLEAARTENDDKDIERANREKHIELTQPDDQERKYEEQSKVVDWQTDKQAEKIKLGKKDTQESVKREPENKDIETDNQSYKNEQCYSGLEHELDNEERGLVVENLKVDTQTDEQKLPADTAVKEAVEISSQNNDQNVEGQSSNKEAEICLNLHETTEILEKKGESPDVANDIKVHDSEKNTNEALKGKPIPEEYDDKEIQNIGMENNEDGEKKPKTERPQETKQNDHLNLDIQHETPSEQKRIYTNITENIEVKEKEIDKKLKTETEEKCIESIFQGKQYTGTVQDTGSGIQEKKDKEQNALDDGQTDKQADIELEEERIDPSKPEKTALLIQDNEDSNTTVLKPEDEKEKLTEPIFQEKTDSIERNDEVSQVKTDKHVDEKKRKEARVIEKDSIEVDDDKQNDAKQKRVDDEIAEKQDGEMNKEIKYFLAEDETSDGKEPIDFIKGTTAKNEENNDNFEVVQTEDGNERHDEAFDIKAMHKLLTEENVNQKQLVESRKGKEEDKTVPDHQDRVENVERHDNEQNIDLEKQNQQSTEVEKQLKTEKGDDENEALSGIQKNLNEESKEKAHKTGNMEEQFIEEHENKDPKEMCANNSNNPTVEADSMSSTAQKPSELKLGSRDATGVEEEEGQSADKIYGDIAGNFEGISGKEILSKNSDNTSKIDTFFQDREKDVNESKIELQVKENDTCLQHLETTDAKESRQATSDEANAHSDHEDREPHTDLGLASKSLDEKVNTEKESQKTIESGEVGHSEIDVDTDSCKTFTQTHINMSIDNNLEISKKDNETEVLDKKQDQDGKNIQYYSPACEPVESIPAILPAYLEPGSNESYIEMASLGSDSIRNLLSLPEGEFQKDTTDMEPSYNADVASHGDDLYESEVRASEKTDKKANVSELSEHLKMEERVETDTEQFSVKIYHLKSSDQDFIGQDLSEKHSLSAMPDVNKITELIETRHKTGDDMESEVQVTVKEESKSDTREQAGMKTSEDSKETEDVTNDSGNQRINMLEDIKGVKELQSRSTKLSETDNSYSHETTFVPPEETSIEKSQTETTDKSASFESDSSHKTPSEVVNESKSEHDINTDQGSDITSDEQSAVEAIESESIKFENKILKEHLSVSELDSSKISLEQVEDEKHDKIKSTHQKSQEITNEVLDQKLKIDQLSSEIIQKDVDANENIHTSDGINVAEETGETLEEDTVDEIKSKGKKQIKLNDNLDSNVSESTEAMFSRLDHALTGHKKDDTTAEKDVIITKTESNIANSPSSDNVYRDSREQNLISAGLSKINIANDGIQSIYLSTEDTGGNLEKRENEEGELDKKLENQSIIRSTVSEQNVHDEEGSSLSVEDGKTIQDKKNIEHGHTENRNISQDIKILITNATDDSESTETQSSSTSNSNCTYTATSEPSSSTETTSTSVFESLDESEQDSTTETEIKDIQNERSVDCTLILQDKQDKKVELHDQKKSCTPVHTSSSSDTSIVDETAETEISTGTQEQKCVNESQSGSNSISGTSTKSQTPKELEVEPMKTYTSVTEKMSEQSDHKDKIRLVVKDDKEYTKPVYENEQISSDDKNGEQVSPNMKEKIPTATQATPVNIEGYQIDESQVKLSENESSECSKEVSERNATNFSQDDTFTSVSKFTTSSRFTETALVDDSEQDEIIKSDKNGEEKDSKDLLPSVKDHNSAQKEYCLSESLIIEETGRKLEDKRTLNGEQTEDNAELRLNSGISDIFGSETKDRDNGTVDIYNQDTSQGISDISEASLGTNDGENNDSEMSGKSAESGISQKLIETTSTSPGKADELSPEAQIIDIPKSIDEQIDIASANELSETTSEQSNEKKETPTTHQSTMKGENNGIVKQGLSSSEAQLDRSELKDLFDRQAPTEAISEMKTTPESFYELKDADSAIQQGEKISESAGSKVVNESSSDVKDVPVKMASNETTSEISPTPESSSESKDAKSVQDQSATKPDYTCKTFIDESTSTIQMDVSDTKYVPDKVAPKETSEMSPTSISTNLLKDAKVVLDHSATNSTSTSTTYIDGSTSAVQLGKSDAILESDSTTKSLKKLKDAKLVMDMGVSRTESSGITNIDESFSETQLDRSDVKEVELSNLLKTSEWTIDQSTLKQEHTDSTYNNESTAKIQLDGSDVKDISDKHAPNETTPERKPKSESSNELKDADSNVGQNKTKPESNGFTGIDESPSNVKELLQVHVETEAPSAVEPKPESFEMLKNAESVPDKNLTEPESTFTKDIDKSTFDIHFNGSDVTDTHEKQAQIETTSELTDAKAVIAEGLTKLDAIGLNDIDKSLSNVKDVLDEPIPTDTTSEIQPTPEPCDTFKDMESVKDESALKPESTRATDIDDYISKTQSDRADFEDIPDKKNSNEAQLEIEHSLELPNILKDKKIVQSASETTSPGLKDIDKSISNVKTVPSKQAQIEARSKIESSPEPNNELKDAESVLDQSATKLKSTSTTLIGEYTSKKQLDAFDEKDKPEKQVPTQETSDLLQTPESSDKLKDANPVVDKSALEKGPTGNAHIDVSTDSKDTDKSTSYLKDVSDEQAQTETMTEVGPTSELCEELKDRESVVDQSSRKPESTGSKDIDKSTSTVQFEEPEVSVVPNKKAQSEETSETLSTQESSNEFKDAELVIDNRATKPESSGTTAIDDSSSSIQLDGSDEKYVFDKQTENEAITKKLPSQESPNELKEAESVKYQSSLKQETIESAIIYESTGSNHIDESTPDLKEVIEEPAQTEAKSEMEPILESCHKLKDVESVIVQSATKQESTGSKVICESTGSKNMDETTLDVTDVTYQQAPAQGTSELQHTPQPFKKLKDGESVENRSTAKPRFADLKDIEESISKIQLEGSDVKDIVDQKASIEETSEMEPTPKAFYEFKDAESVSGQSTTNLGSIDWKDIDETTSNSKDKPDKEDPIHSTKIDESTFAKKANGSDVKEVPEKLDSTEAPSGMLSTPEILNKLKDTESITDESAYKQESTNSSAIDESNGSKDIDESTSDLKELSDEQIGLSPESGEKLKDEESVVDQRATNSDSTFSKDIDESTSNIHFEGSDVNNVPDKQVRTDATSELELSPESAYQLKDAESVLGQITSKSETTDLTVIDECTGPKEIDESLLDLKEVSDEQAQTEMKSEVEPTPQTNNKLKDEETVVEQSTTNQESTCSKDIDESTSNIELEGSNVNNVPERQAQTGAASDIEPTPKSAGLFKNTNSLIDQSALMLESNDSTVIGESTGSKDIDESSSVLKEVSDEQTKTEARSEVEPKPESCNKVEDDQSVEDQSTTNLETTSSTDIDETTSNMQFEGSNVKNIPDKQDQIEATSKLESTPIIANQCKNIDSVKDQSTLKLDSTDSTDLGESPGSKDIDESSSDLKDVSDGQAQTDTKSEDEPKLEPCNKLEDNQSVEDRSTTNQESPCSTDIDESTSNIALEELNVKNTPDKHAQTEATSEMESTSIVASQFKDASLVIDQSSLEPASTETVVIGESTGLKDIDDSSTDLKEIPDEQAQTETKSEVEPAPESCNQLEDEESVLDLSSTNQYSTCSKNIDESTSNIQLTGSDVSDVPDKQAQTEGTSEMETTSVVLYQCKDVDSVIDQRTLKPDSTDFIVIGKNTCFKDIDEPSLGLKEVSDEQAETESKSEVEESVENQSATNLESTCSKEIDESTSNIQLGGSNVNNVPDNKALSEAISEMESTVIISKQCKDVNSVIDQCTLKPDSTDSTVIASKDTDGSLSDLKEVSDEQAKTDTESEVEPTPKTYNKLNDKESDENHGETNQESICSKTIGESTSNIQFDGSNGHNVPDKQVPSEATLEMEPTPKSPNQFKDANIDQSVLRPDSTDSTVIAKSTGSKDIYESSSDLKDVSDEQAQTEAKSGVEPTPESCNKLKDEESVEGQSATNQESTCSTDIDESTSMIQFDGSNVNKVPDKQAQTEATSDMATTSIVANQCEEVNSVIDQRTLKPGSTDSIVIGESMGSKDIEKSSSDLKEVSEKSVVDQNTASQESTCSKDNDESSSNIQLDASDVNNLQDKQPPTETTSEMEFTAKSAGEFEDVETILDQNATKPEYTGSTVIDETKSNVKDVTDNQAPAKAISDKEPFTESSNQLEGADSVLDQTMLESICITDIDKSTLNLKDLPNKQAQTEQASEMEQTTDSSKELKDAESVITQGAVEPVSTVITDTDEFTSKIRSDVKDLPNNQAPTEANVGIKPTPESSNGSKDAESVIDQTAKKPESTCTTVTDESDVKDVNEKDALTQTTPETRLSKVSLNQMKDELDMEQSTKKPVSLRSEDINESLPKQQIEGSEGKDVLVDPALAHVTSETDSTPRSSSEETSYTDTFETLSDGQTTQESRFQTSQTSGKVTSQIPGDMKESATTELRRSSLSDLEELPLE